MRSLTDDAIRVEMEARFIATGWDVETRKSRTLEIEDRAKVRVAVYRGCPWKDER